MSETKWTFSQKFYADFNVTASELALRLDAMKSRSIVSPDAMQTIASDLSRMTKSLSDATGSLPSYDQRQCELQLKALEKNAEDLRGASTSTPKFSFKRRPTKPKVPAEPVSTAGVAPTHTRPSTSISSARTLSSFSHRYLTIANLDAKDSSEEVSISDLDNCIVNLLPKGGDDRTKITAFHVRRLSKCVLVLPHISGSILLYDLSECVVVTGCHQFRMHNSTSVDVYLAIESNPIIEHCSNIRFTGYPTSLASDVVRQDSNHFTVQDFSHIRPTPSPNWSVLSEEESEPRWPVSEVDDQSLSKELQRMLQIRRGGSVEGTL
ncbi:hypothetical protein PAXRUDRAFT_829544 [Paxillus rubicundulus Ve08.2h10]|uniref:Unplaced genomic scaffold scaffold_410, whole genome shotgun sequence n=1 Tax=Paxillus rubicundulus Ve08.2h10 TaxID=930991 RepID=A0A0D0DML8_9AGAM|nr:hypothetical protein PAXRUDRAFT_829544 [Paxillus rubicundulus Ve08.2h10]